MRNFIPRDRLMSRSTSVLILMFATFVVAGVVEHFVPEDVPGNRTLAYDRLHNSLRVLVSGGCGIEGEHAYAWYLVVDRSASACRIVILSLSLAQTS
jgi:hypothetical protein